MDYNEHPLSNYAQFKWSFSRDRTFRKCLRQYYYRYYGSSQAWYYPGSAIWSAYVMSKLQTRAMWRGEVIHHVINVVFNNYLGKNPIPYEKADEILTDIMTFDWESSRDWLNAEDPLAFHGLIDHYYGGWDYRGNGFEEDLKIARKHLRGLYQSNMLNEITDKGIQVLEKEKFSEFAIQNVPVILKIDLAIRNLQGRAFIVDWKTGRPPGPSASHDDDPEPDGKRQLLLYALYIHTRWNIPYQKISAQDIYLADNKQIPVAIDPSDEPASRGGGARSAPPPLLAELPDDLCLDAAGNRGFLSFASAVDVE